MTVVIERCILKGHLFGLVQTRNMFVAELNVLGSETNESMWSAYLDEVLTPLIPFLSPVFTTDGFELQVKAGSEWTFLEEDVWTNVGTGSGDALPNAVAAVLIGHVAGNRALGRKFFSGLAEIAIDGNSLTATALAAAATSVAAYVSVLSGDSESYLTPGLITKGGTFRPFISGFVASLLGSMRRRKPGLGI